MHYGHWEVYTGYIQCIQAGADPGICRGHKIIMYKACMCKKVFLGGVVIVFCFVLGFKMGRGDGLDVPWSKSASISNAE